MQICGKLGIDGEKAFSVLAFGLAEQLLPSATEHFETRLEGFKNFNCLAAALH